MVAVLHPESSELVSPGGDSATAGASASADETFESTLAATAGQFETIRSKEVATATSPMPRKIGCERELKWLTEDGLDDYNGDGEKGVRRRRRGQRLR